MSVKQWKQIITITVILVIVSLLILTIVFASRSGKYQDFLESDKVVDLTGHELDSTELEGLLSFLDSVDVNATLEYQTLYPDLYVDNDFQFVAPKEKVCYLTFDDGPDVENTTSILNTLKRYNIKATFFVIYKDDEDSNELYKRIVEEGHTIAVHSASHDYDEIYASVGDYLKDFEKMSSHIEDVTGAKPELFRFPGGSVNTYNMTLYKELIAEMLRRGYVYYDWNVSSGDAAGAYVSSAEITDNVLSGCRGWDEAIVLMHDGIGHTETAAALPEIIEGLKEQGYTFASLNQSVTPWCFGY